MGFKYRLKIFLDEQTARRAIMTPEVVRRLRSTGTHVEYSSGVLTVESKENHDVDEDLLRALSKAIGKPVDASAELEVNGRIKEIFRGKLDPFKPLGVASEGRLDEEVEDEEVSEENEEELEDEMDLFVDEEELEDELFYYDNEDEDENY
jgi:hypothetical protein